MIKFKLVDQVKQFKLHKRGIYTIFFLGGYSIKNSGDFKVEVNNIDSNQKIKVDERILKSRLFIGFKRATKYYTFSIEEPGNYEITLSNINDLKVYKSMLYLVKLLFPYQRVPLDQIEIYIE